jgi:uncharacterized protein (TIGR03032 family)
VSTPQPTPPTPTAQPAAPAQQPTAPIEFSATRHLPGWLAEQNISLLASTYETGLVFMIGVKPDGSMSYNSRAVARAMGLAVSGTQTIWVGTQFQVWRFENSLQPGQTHQGCDAFYVPRVAYTTGDIDVHDMGIVHNGRPVFVNTAYSCLATVDDTYSFRALWKPPFITKMAAEDRCHLNGMAMVDGMPGYVTCVSRSDAAGGWRDFRGDGGLLIHVPSNEIVLSGLSMPHSPRWHNGKLYLHNSGTGEFGYADLERGKFEPIAFCPGYLRGLSFHNGYAIAGLSMGRHQVFEGLKLQENLDSKGVVARCAVVVIDLEQGDIRHEIRFTGGMRELFDTNVLQGVRTPGTVGYLSDDFLHRITLEPGTT